MAESPHLAADRPLAAFPDATAAARQAAASAGYAPVLCAWLAGSGLQLAQPRLWHGGVYAALLCIALALFATLDRHRKGGRYRACQLAAGAALAAFALAGVRAAAFAGGALDPALEGHDLVVTGTIAAMPQESPTGTRFRFEVASATRDGVDVAVPRFVDLGWWSGPPGAPADALDAVGSAGPATPDLRSGDRWRLPVRLKAPHGSRNPHGFDYERWAWEQGVQAVGSVRTLRGPAAAVRLASPVWSHPVERARQAVRDAVLLRLAAARAHDADSDDDRMARRRAAGVVAALVTGDQRAIARADWDVFRATGVAHLMSISGLHVTMFAWLAAGATGWLWRRSSRLCLAVPAQHAALCGGVALAGLYALFSGGGLPSQRTVFMLAVVAALRLSGRRWPWPQVWLLAGAAAVALDPWALLQAGFWLSFVAVGVLFASTAPPAPVPAGRMQRWRARLGGLLREQAVVTVALAPLTLLLFGQLSLLGLPANLLAIPWTTLVVTPLALLGVVFHPLWDLAALAVRALALPLEVLAAWPHATLVLPAAPAWVAALAVGGGALLCMPLPWHLRLGGVAPLLPALMWWPAPPPPGAFEVLALDVGQGTAVLVRTAGHALLYDTGPRYDADSDAGQRLVVPLLQAEGVRLDTVVLSHRDSDHAGGAAAVLRQQPGATLLSSIEDDHPLQALRPAQRCHAGQRWSWDGVAFSILHPQPADYRPGTASNALSCVLRIESGAHAALLTGDISAADEQRLIASGAPLAADWLMVPHHGSRGSSSPALLDAVRPRQAVAQAGYRNRFGHPTDETVGRYAARGIGWHDSVHCGAARWSSTKPDEIVCQRRHEPFYWQHNVGEP